MRKIKFFTSIFAVFSIIFVLNISALCIYAEELPETIDEISEVMNDGDESLDDVSILDTFVVVQPGLYRGMYNDDVRDLQVCLNQLGYEVDVDSSFGPQTAAAVQTVQETYGLYADGYVDSLTAKLLNADDETRALIFSSMPAEPDYEGMVLTEDVANYVRAIVLLNTTADMSKEEKLWACYSFIGNRDVYPYQIVRIPFYRGTDWPIVYARDMMQDRGSTCQGYAALFGYAAVLCGFDNVHWMQNERHAWVDIDGLVYDATYLFSGLDTAVYGWGYDDANALSEQIGADFSCSYAEGGYEYIPVPWFF